MKTNQFPLFKRSLIKENLMTKFEEYYADASWRPFMCEVIEEIKKDPTNFLTNIIKTHNYTGVNQAQEDYLRQIISRILFEKYGLEKMSDLEFWNKYYKETLNKVMVQCKKYGLC